MRATRDVENSISRREMSPTLDSEHFEKGSVVYIRKPLEVAMARVLTVTWAAKNGITYRQPDGCCPG